MQEEKLEGGRSNVFHKDGVLYREAQPWSDTVQSLLKHLEKKNFNAAPRVLGSGYDEQGREILSYIEGDFVHPKPWTDDALISLGKLLRSLHDSARDFKQSKSDIWRPWFGRQLRKKDMVIGHGDFAPWNIITREDMPYAVIDWENAGPVDRLVELAHVIWLNVQLCDEDVSERVGLAPAEKRAQQARILTDAYGLPHEERQELVQTVIDVATLDAADQAIEGKITPEIKTSEALWGLAWRTRSAAWIIHHRDLLQRCISES